MSRFSACNLKQQSETRRILSSNLKQEGLFQLLISQINGLDFDQLNLMTSGIDIQNSLKIFREGNPSNTDKYKHCHSTFPSLSSLLRLVTALKCLIKPSAEMFNKLLQMLSRFCAKPLVLDLILWTQKTYNSPETVSKAIFQRVNSSTCWNLDFCAAHKR